MKHTTPEDKPIRIPSWLHEPYSVLSNPAYRCPAHTSTRTHDRWGHPTNSTTAANCSISGTIKQEEPVADQKTTDDMVTRTFCKLTSGIRVTRSHQVFTALFSGELSITFGEKQYNRKVFKQGVRAFDIGNYRYVEQNPRTSSQWGHAAREGCRIMWIIRLSDNKWLGRVVEGTLTTL